MIKLSNEDNLTKQNQYLTQQLEDQKQQVSDLLITPNNIIYNKNFIQINYIRKKLSDVSASVGKIHQEIESSRSVMVKKKYIGIIKSKSLPCLGKNF